MLTAVENLKMSYAEVEEMQMSLLLEILIVNVKLNSEGKEKMYIDDIF